MSNIVEKYKKFIEILNSKSDRVEIPILNDIALSTRERIHEDGLDSSLVKIGLKGGSKKAKAKGEYSPPYMKIKGKIFPRVLPINLFLRGDLAKAIEVAKADGVNVLRLSDTVLYNGITAAELAQIHERTYNTTLYRPHPNQLIQANEQVLGTVLTEVIEESMLEAGFTI